MFCDGGKIVKCAEIGRGDYMKVYKADTTYKVVEVGDTLTIDSEDTSFGYLEVKVLQIIKVDFKDDLMWFYGCEVDQID